MSLAAALCAVFCLVPRPEVHVGWQAHPEAVRYVLAADDPDGAELWRVWTTATDWRGPCLPDQTQRLKVAWQGADGALSPWSGYLEERAGQGMVGAAGIRCRPWLGEGGDANGDGLVNGLDFLVFRDWYIGTVLW